MDTSAARANILARIRDAQGHTRRDTAERVARAQDWIDRHPRAPGPTLGADLVAHFEAQARRMASTTARVARLADAPAAIAGFLRDNGLPMQGVRWRTLDALDWAGAGLSLAPRAPRDGDLVGVTGVFAAIAETGTLLLLSGADTPASTHLLPETHLAIVPAARIVAHYEDAFARVRATHGALPRAMNLVSGPSRTGDIEQTIVLGAHGPYRVHILIVEDDDFRQSPA